MSDHEHPARRAGLLSQKHVSEGNRDAWLDLFAEDALLADPVGPSPLDPAGQGHRGRAAITAFYDKFISMGEVSFDYPRSYACANECAFIGTVYTQVGDHPERASEGVFVYKVDAEGKILSLRAFWEIARPTLESDIHPAVGRSRSTDAIPPGSTAELDQGDPRQRDGPPFHQ